MFFCQPVFNLIKLYGFQHVLCHFKKTWLKFWIYRCHPVHWKKMLPKNVCRWWWRCFKGSRNYSMADSPTHRYGKSIFDYEYLHEFQAKIKTARKLVWGTYADLNYANYAGHCFSFFSSSGTTCISFKNSIADSPTHRYGESTFHYEYLHEFEPKVETARKLVWGTYADLNYAKTSENSVHCHVPLITFFWG